MPYDWLFEVERIIISLVPAYTLEMLDICDIDRLLPYYFFDYRKALTRKKQEGNAECSTITGGKCNNYDIVVRNGKKYRVVKADQATWLNQAF